MSQKLLHFYFSEDFTWETYNAILLVRSFSKYFIEFLPNEEVIKQLGGSVVKSQGDEEVSGFTEHVLHCTGKPLMVITT